MKALVQNTHDCRTEREMEFNTIQDLLDLNEQTGESLIISKVEEGEPEHIDFRLEIYDDYRE